MRSDNKQKMAVESKSVLEKGSNVLGVCSDACAAHPHGRGQQNEVKVSTQDKFKVNHPTA